MKQNYAIAAISSFAILMAINAMRSKNKSSDIPPSYQMGIVYIGGSDKLKVNQFAYGYKGQVPNRIITSSFPGYSKYVGNEPWVLIVRTSMFTIKRYPASLNDPKAALIQAAKDAKG